jgi:hypothetical protein
MEKNEKINSNDFLGKKRKESTDKENISSISSINTQERQTISKKFFKIKNRKRLLRNKLDFFLSDVNLYYDKYLKEIYLSNNESVTPEIFLAFNSIKNLLYDIKKEEDKKNVIIKAIEISNKLIYDKSTNQIKRKTPFNEKLINNELLEKSTIYIQNLPPMINHLFIYDLFKDYKILYIKLLKGKKRDLTGEAFVILKNIDDVNNIITKYNNSIPKLLSSINPKVLKPLKIITKEDYLKNQIKEDNTINKINHKQINSKNNIDENALIKINNIKEKLTLKEAKKCLYNIAFPSFIDINNNDNSMILRFDTKNDSDLFLGKIKEKNYEDIKDMLKDNNKNDLIEELNEKERKEYLDLVKIKIENYKEKKENSNKKIISNE